jgi:hypothetical protein
MKSMDTAAQESIESPTSDSANKTVSARLSAHELSQLEGIAKRCKLTNSALVRELILEKIQTENGPPKADPLLTEIVGVRLLLLNLLGPMAAGAEPLTKQRVDAIVDEIKKVKHKAALQIQNAETCNEKP